MQAFVSQASESSVLLRMIADRATYQLPLRTAVYLPDGDMTARVVGPGEPVPIQGFDLNRSSVDSFKIAGAFAVTEDLVRNISPAGQAFLNGQLRAAVAKASDVELFSRLMDSGTLSLDGGADAASILAAVREALAAVITRATDRAYFTFSVQAANYLSALEGAPDDMNPWDGTFLGRPAIITEGLSGMIFAVVNAQSFVGAVDTIDIAASNAGTVELLDNPTNNSIEGTATTQVSLWQSNSIAVMVVAHLACEAIRTDGVANIEIQPATVSA